MHQRSCSMTPHSSRPKKKLRCRWNVHGACRGAIIAAAIACLVQSTASFVVTPTYQSRHQLARASHSWATSTTRALSVARRRHRRQVGVYKPWKSERPSNLAAASLETSVAEATTAPVRPVSSVAEAKKELLSLAVKGATGGEHTSDEVGRVAYLLGILEGSFIPIQTAGFFNLAIQGDWHLAFTNAYMPPIGPRLTVSEQFQQINPNDGGSGEGSLTNVLVWRLLDEGINGRLEVGCDYGLDSRGRMNMSLRIHRLLPDEKMPSDPEGLVGLLQRAMPRELFDPNEHALETTFLDESMRIVRVRGQKLEGRLNVFVRDPSSLEPAAPEKEFKTGAGKESVSKDWKSPWAKSE